MKRSSLLGKYLTSKIKINIKLSEKLAFLYRLNFFPHIIRIFPEYNIFKKLTPLFAFCLLVLSFSNLLLDSSNINIKQKETNVYKNQKSNIKSNQKNTNLTVINNIEYNDQEPQAINSDSSLSTLVSLTKNIKNNFHKKFILNDDNKIRLKNEIANWELAQFVFPDHKHIDMKLAVLYYQNGNREKALMLLNDLKIQNPENKEVLSLIDELGVE